MTLLRATRTDPPIFYLHDEGDIATKGATSCFGLSAGYLAVRRLSPMDRALWLDLFQKRWRDACELLGHGLVALGVDAFTLVPCSRQEVVAKMRGALLSCGMREIADLVTKNNASVSFAGRSFEYIAEHTQCGIGESLTGVQCLAVCDEFSDSGRTLLGLYRVLVLHHALARRRVVMASVGVSRGLSAGHQIFRRQSNTAREEEE